MKNMVYCVICNILLVALVILTSCCRNEVGPAVVPVPVHVCMKAGSFTVDEDTRITIENASQRPVAEWFAGLFRVPAAFVPEVCEGSGNAQIRLKTDSTLVHEAYRLHVGRSGIEVYAGGSAGLFYALQTLRQALPEAIESDVPVPDVIWEMPAMDVYDAPRFRYRGLMVDVSRYFLPKSSLLDIIDCMSMLKLNNLHLHLTDDNGWRLEIRKYPLLTSVGAWRVDRGDVPFPDRKNPVEGEPTPVGGFYTQDDMREIVAYAAERQINVVPEIDIPAHSNSALAAYPHLACPVVDEYIGVLPGLGGGNADIIYCAGNDEVLGFLRDVVDEVCEIFPSKYIHLGGDEAWKTYWKICPLCQKRIYMENLEDEAALQGWFMSQMNDYLKSKGRIMMAWDEVTESEIPDGAVVFGWRADGEAALKAAELGHDFVLTPSEKLYLIRYQGPQWHEPLTYFGNSTLSDVYAYEPMQDSWSEVCKDRLMGIQGSMWTEFCHDPDDVTYQIFPRLSAVAEVAWSPPSGRHWCDFVRRMDSFNRRLDMKGIIYSKAMYNIQHEVSSAEDGGLDVRLFCERPDVRIRYTMDGMEPSRTSAKYDAPVKVYSAVTMKAATFSEDGTKTGETMVLPIGRSKSTASRVMSGRPSAKLLVNGVKGSLRQTDFEWCHFHDDAELVLDLGAVTDVGQVRVGALTNYGMAFNKPSSMSLLLSTDGRGYAPAGMFSWSEDEIFCEGNFREDIEFAFAPRPARYVRIKAVHPGVCPENHIRAGQLSKFCFDEIDVYGPPASLNRTAVSGVMFTTSARKDTLSAKDMISDRSWKNLLRWSAAGGL